MFIKIPEHDHLIHCGSIESICIDDSGKLFVSINAAGGHYTFEYKTPEQTRIAFSNVHNQVQALS